MKKKSEAGYNERLFSGGIRGRFHNARYQWVADRIVDLGCATDSILELGCFDGKVIDYLPRKPSVYLGLDANWENGLDLARKKWANHPEYVFRECTRPEEMRTQGREFDVSLCMETLEHIPPNLVRPYLKELGKVTRSYLLITVPNEIGPVFLSKYAVKSVFGDVERYTPAEVMYAALGRADKVERSEHKGFDYRRLVDDVSKYFEVIEVSGHPIGLAPPMLNYGIGIVGRVRSP